MPRELERLDFVAQVELESGSGRREAQIRDISSGGCYIDTSITGIQDGEQVKFDLVHPNGSKLPFSGQVSYHFEGIGFGIKFIDTTPEQDLFIQRIVRK